MNEYIIDKITSEYLAKVEQLNREFYDKTTYACDCWTELAVGQDTFSVRPMLVPVDGYTHIAKVIKNGVHWLHAKKLEPEELERAPEGCTWEVDNEYAKEIRFCFG